ncbi:mtDNA inheritance, partitioning of the mitochondrial organelle [Thecaphora frezii]
MSQREIIYLSFGPYSNHVATHFWNAQQSYFSYDSTDPSCNASSSDRDPQTDPDEPLIHHDTSFKPGQGAHGQDTYCPRTLIFETQQEFGSLRKLNPLYDQLDLADAEYDDYNTLLTQLGAHAITTWGSVAQVHSSQRIPKSDYQKRLELEDRGYDIQSDDQDQDDDDDDDDGDGEANQHRNSGNGGQHDHQPAAAAAKQGVSASPPAAPQRPSKRSSRFRFWSDYSRVYYHPKSLVTVGGQLMAPMAGSYNSQTSDGDDAHDGRTRFERYEQGHVYFKQLERECETLDDNLRWFAEDSDLLQGFQHTVNTSDAFGGLGTAYLEAIQDEFPKATQLVFGAAWGSTVQQQDAGETANRLARLRRMNNALALLSLVETATILVPLWAPTSILTGGARPQTAPWAKHLAAIDLEDMHHASALLSAHIETATLGARLRTRPEPLPSLAARLNWRRDTKIAHLGGFLPPPTCAPSFSSSSTHEAAPPPSAPLDPIEALLASRGYGSHDRNGASRHAVESAAQRSKRGAKLMQESWLDLSLDPETRIEKRKHILEAIRRPYAASFVARDEETDYVRSTLGALDRFVELKEPLGSGIYAPLSYALPSSYPKLFTSVCATGRPIPNASNTHGLRPRSIPVLSGLVTSSATVNALRHAKQTVQEAIESHLPLAAYGLGSSAAATGAGAAANEENEGVVGGRDGLKEVRERAEDLLSAYDGEGEDEVDVGTDEEFETVVREDLEWDL